MTSTRENVNQSLSYTDFDVRGGVLRAFYDASGRLVFVLDYSVSSIKPNVLLVMDLVPGRKWDDVLVNDFGVDLETIRPKKDNKYQKLDVEYSGLKIYDNLFHALQGESDVDLAIGELDVFRRDAARNAATERLSDAHVMAERARETIERTTLTLDELHEKQKMLRAKLVAQRRQVGKEPTKQSAAKILRTESQIDVIADKIARAKKRIDSAQRRLANAEDDAEIARGVLDGVNDAVKDFVPPESGISFVPVFDADVLDVKDEDGVNLPGTPENTDVAVVDVPPVPMVDTPQFTEITTFEDNTQKLKADDMADEDVKPLFDKDPNIIDEENAFKPIDFNASVVPDDNLPVVPSDDLPAPVDAPMSFVPPLSVEPAVDNVVPVEPAPVLNSITSVSAPVEQIDSELLAGFDDQAPTTMPDVPAVPQYSSDDVAVNEPEPMPEITPAPDVAPVRPVSPISGAAAPVAAGVDSARRKPTALYYVLLIVLIVLSIFTLWMYQGSQTDALPEIGASSQPDVVSSDGVQAQTTGSAFIDVTVNPDVAQETTVDQADVAPTPVVAPEPVVETVAETVVDPVVATPTEQVIVPDVEASVVSVTENPVVVPEVEPQLVQVTPEVVKDADADVSPFLSQEEVVPVKAKPIAEIIAEKPVYNVSQQEEMFVADSEYETDDDTAVPDVVVNQVVSEPEIPTVEYSQPTVVTTPVVTPAQPVVVEHGVEYSEPMAVTQQQFLEEEVVEACADGSAPDKNGCCPGENYVNVVGAGYACCVESTGECFPPMK